MSEVTLFLAVLVALVTMIFFRFEIAFGLLIVSYLWIVVTDLPNMMVAARAIAGVNNFILLAVPFFLLAGELMNNAGITERLVRVANLTVGRIRGGLAQANIVASILFAGISGAAVADVAALGRIFIPAMADEGYTREFSAALTAASSTIGPIIPPSILLVLYGALAQTSVGGLFAAGIVPGIVLGLALMTITAITARRRNFPKYDADIQRNEYPRLAFDTVTAMTMPAIILVGLLGGFFTATEAAAAACAYAVLLGAFGYRTLSPSNIFSSLRDTTFRTAQLYVIIGFAAVFSWILAREGIPQLLTQTLEGYGLGPIGFMILLSFVLVFIGTWLDPATALIILAGPLSDIATTLGIHPLHFGIVMVIALNFGLITPPVGISLFVASSVSETPVWPIAREVVPFYAAQIATLLVVVFVPQSTLLIPRLTGLI